MDAPAPLVHLDVRSCFSLKEGAFSPEQLAHAAAELGMPAVALTDRDGLYGARTVRRSLREGGHPADPRAPRSPCVRPAGGERRGHATDAHIVLLAIDDAGLREPVPADHRRAHAGDAGRSLGRTPEQICAHAGGLDRPPGPAVVPGPARASPAASDAAARAAGPFREAFGRAPATSRPQHRVEARSGEEVRAMLRLAERLARTRRRHERRALPRAGGRVPRRRPRVHARIVPLAPNHVTRANAEGWLKPAHDDARAVRRAPGPLRRHARDSPSGARSTSASAGALPGLPHAGRPRAPTPSSPSGAGAASTSAACGRPPSCATACTTSSR